MKSIKHIAVVGILLFLTFFLQSQNCVIPDNGSGTPTLPPIGCEYSSPDEVFMIIDGLPPGTTIELDGIYSDFICCDGSCPCSLPILPGECEAIGGSLGGNGHCFRGTMFFDVVGTGDLAGFNRTLNVQIFSEIHTGPRNPGDPVQSFPTDFYRLNGQLFGDPDFCTFNIIAGTDFGLPSPGQTTLTQLSTGDFVVDSFFDITYQIEFEGCPGSALDGFAGVTTATIRFEIPYVAGNDFIDPGTDFWTAPEGGILFGGEDLPPIPADFFEPGSDPFEGQIDFEGGALDPPPFPDFDVLIERIAPGNVPPPYPVGATIDVEIVELRLVSTEPITVTYVGGGIQEWFVEVSLSVIPSPNGYMDVIKENPDGGIFSYMPLNVQPSFTFTLVTDPNEKRTWDTGLDGISSIVFNSSINDYPWEHSPIGNDFNATADYPMPLSTVSGECTLELLPYLLREDDFWANVTPEGIVGESGGSGYNDGEWYYYPNTDWWNIWFYDHPFDNDRTKEIDVSFTIDQLDPSQGSYATIVFNWATGDWSENGFPRPPLPEDVYAQVLEDLYIVRSIPVFSGVVDGPIFIEQYFYEIFEYNPEWISIDISGYNFSLYDGVINHVCKQNDGGGELFELGDAPEMALAYPSTNIMGTFPTCMNEPAAGFIAHNDVSAWLGPIADYEAEGNAGFCPTFNPDMYNRDECFNDGDAGLIFPDGFTINGPIGSEVVQPCSGVNGAPLGFICQNAEWGVDIDIDVHNHISSGDQAYVNLLIDWDQNGNWGGSINCPGFAVPEHVLVDFPIPNPFDGPISALLAGVTIPIGANSGYVWARFSITDTPVGLDWNGEGFFEYGETEDYLLWIIEDDEEIDFGDAPDPNYRTLLANNGARHAIEPGFSLGVSIDPEFDGQPDVFATGDDNDGNDDEDGVVFLNSFVPGQIATIKVTLAEPFGTGGLLDPWIDFNMNGVFDHPAEHLCGGTSCVLNPGTNIINFNVPVGTPVNSQTYARFRLSRNGGLMPFGYAPDGEVEDYMVFIHDTITDAKMHFPQYPDPFGWDVNITYPNIMADDWMCSETGAVNDFHFWVSWLDDIYPDNIDETIQKIHVSIHSDIPADPPLIPYSKPGDLLWERDFMSGEYVYDWYLEGPQGWYDPLSGTVLQNNHLNCFRIDIDGFEDPFVQQEGTIYWMDVYIELVGGAGGADMVTVTLDNVDPTIPPYLTWVESDVILGIMDYFGTVDYLIEPDGINLWPALLMCDLINLAGNVISAEVDVIPWCLPSPCGAEVTLYEGAMIIDQKGHMGSGAMETIIVNNPGGNIPDRLTIACAEGKVLEIRFILETGDSYQIGWKTTLDHWNDDAVYSILPDIYWQELLDPFTEESLDMAFAVTGNPIDDLDWGDAPDGAAAPQYPTLAINYGASHIIDNITYLGDSIDGENDGIPDPNALGDDNDNFDDEDGVFFPAPLLIGQTVTIDVVASIDGFLNAWVDFNINGNWGDAFDQIFYDELLLSGTNSITFNIPASATAGMTFARFRFDTFGGLSYDGPGPAGEVEDYEIELIINEFKWQQLPDLSFFGMDVDATYDMDGNQPPHILADDFECTMTGPITNIKVWGSWIYDYLPFGSDPGSVVFTLSIHKDIPAGVIEEYSMPGEVLWWKTFNPGEFTFELFADNLQEGWYDPVTGFYLPNGDTQCWLYSFDIETDQFIQSGTSDEPIIYWLDVQAQPLDSEPDCRFGWKTSEMHWNDDGVWTVGEEPYNGIWNELTYPPGHELQGLSIDLAFEINGSEIPYYLVDLTAFLEGPYNGADMDTLLNVAGIIPFNQPFDVDPTAIWYYTGTESVSAIPINVVDWVLVELRDATSAPLATGSTMIEQNAAFILNDGSIVATDGSSMVTFNTMFVNSPYIVIWHRNHLGVLSAYPIGFVAPGVYSYDFTIPAGQAYLNGQKDLGGGIYGMFGGDAAPDGLIDLNDKNLWTNEAGNTGYKAEDFDMDTQVDNKDKDDIWVPNEGEGTKVPN